jgi:hypothetical protein
MLFDDTWAIPHVISTLVATAFLLASVHRPLLARKLYAALFVYATLVNAAVAFFKPLSYLDNARYALLESYRSFILGWFADHIALVVGSISFAQALITAGLIIGGVWARASLSAAIIFFVAISPLGVASAFPSSLIWALGAGWLLFNVEGRRSLEGSLPRLSPGGLAAGA